MNLEKDLKRLFVQLNKDQFVKIAIGGDDITLIVSDDASKISLGVSVYFGGNYIPSSVRKCIKEKPDFDEQAIPTFVTIDEQAYQIRLNYVGLTSHLNSQKFVSLLEDFSWLAQEWQMLLDGHDKDDLIHVRVN